MGNLVRIHRTHGGKFGHMVELPNAIRFCSIIFFWELFGHLEVLEIQDKNDCESDCFDKKQVLITAREKLWPQSGLVAVCEVGGIPEGQLGEGREHGVGKVTRRQGPGNRASTLSAN